MKVLICGQGGQLAWELERIAPDNVDVISLGKDALDITDGSAVADYIKGANPDLVINAAAYTAVDQAESDKEAAYAVNEQGAANLAKACNTIGCRMLHVSTDFVFDGKSACPYSVDSEPNPLNVYGASKLAGERAVLAQLPRSSVVVRTSWVYSVHGNNFVKTMLRLMREKDELGIIWDQVGAPTWAKGLAEWIWVISSRSNVSGVYHWSDGGVASWYDFAVAIQDLAIEKGLLSKEIPVRPIRTEQYPTPAVRPSFSVIDKASAEAVSGLKVIHWRRQLSMMMDAL